jgi:GntR family transcriptional regulator/MocR family aminotransferase
MREFAFTPDRASAEPLYRQLVAYFEDLIESGRLVPGERLPPTRELASALGIGRNTIALTYETLEAAGRVTSHVGRGTFVIGGASAPRNPIRAAEAPGAFSNPADSARTFAWSGLFAARTQGLLRLPPADAPLPQVPLDFRGGRIDPSSLPHFEIQKAFVRALQKHFRPLANHFDPQGYAPLRAEIARSLFARGIRCAAGDVLVTNGAQQALDLIARALVDPGDTVVVEKPGYFGATLAFRAAQAHLLGVPVDAEGMKVDELLRLTRTRRVKLIYTTPAVQMPTGVRLSDTRRRALLELADREQIPVVDDDYDGEFRVEGPIIPALKTSDPGGLVIYVGTLTKVLYPGLRLGYVVAAPPLIEMLARVRFTANFQPSLIDQIAAAEFMISGDFGRHVRRLRKRHAKKREALLDALDASMPSSLHWSRPVAGSTVWIDLPEDLPLDDLQRRAMERGLAFQRGDLFGLGTGETPGIGLTFGSLSVAQIREGVGILAGLIRETRAASRIPKAGRGIGSPPRKPSKTSNPQARREIARLSRAEERGPRS